MGNMSTSKTIREKIWTKLKDVAKPDSRFHMNFAEVIPGFEGDDAAVARVRALTRLSRRAPSVRDARQLPRSAAPVRDRGRQAHDRLDLRHLSRLRALEPGMVPEGQALFASWLDGMEHFGVPSRSRKSREMGRFDYLVTGASAVSINGMRFGKGHGFFDLEWGMFTDLGLADERTPVRAVAHDVQLVEETLQPSRPTFLST
jgi:5-formyltetrahydrofolate cyclo-ligase